ncbi:tRNA pseudouridine(38-40) synthase TruA [Acidithiobacillus sp. IBUN Pt1247-S3]|uniref:tRNA pseudouridine(38-40) synthase TruA n=1 Tax=Acidithiobacillus sp. IBUN Pt1247-S3 TaxID=3166642 RepID=UPI0034E40A1A
MGLVGQRWALGVEYDGSGFAGWQLQDGPRTVQGVLEGALAAIAGHPIRVSVAGRTDAGVHALCQVLHFDSSVVRPEIAWVRGSNRFLPREIAVRWAKPVPQDFHARFSATGRSYRYLILNRQERPALAAGRVTWVPQPLDHRAMQEASSLLLGTHDFSAFRASACQAKSPVRSLRRLDLERRDDLLIATVEANAFLHHMVRNLIGTLLFVGRGERPPGWVAEVLASCDRRLAGATAPADGLYFHSVSYPQIYRIPSCSGIFV